jgi:hypothetical protein
MRSGCNAEKIPQLPKDLVDYFENGQKRNAKSRAPASKKS